MINAINVNKKQNVVKNKNNVVINKKKVVKNKKNATNAIRKKNVASLNNLVAVMLLMSFIK